MASISNGEAGSSVRTKLNNTGLRLNNYAAISAPTAGDDTADGYEVGSLWLDTTNDKLYVAQDVTATAAVWTEVVGTAATQTLTNKTVTAPVLSGTVTGTYTIGGTPTFPSTVVSTTGTQTLTNKTLTAPVLGGTVTGTFTIGGTPTVAANVVPDADGTRNLGSSANRWANVHADSIDLNGSTITATATKTAPDGDVVGTSDTQTLTNKTLTSPKSSYTSHNAGTKSSGTYTPAYTDGNMQYAVNGGAHTLAPQTGDGVIIIHYTNNGSAGTITTSGFTAVKGDSLTTTNTHKFIMTSVVINSNSVLTIQALQ